MKLTKLLATGALCLLFGPIQHQAQTCTSTQSGDWLDSNTWGGTAARNCDDFVITTGIQVDIDTRIVTVTNGSVTVQGTLNLIGEDDCVPFGILNLENSPLYIPAGGQLSGNCGGFIINGSEVYSPDGTVFSIFSADGTFAEIIAAGGLNAGGALPVELLYFRAGPDGPNVRLEWATASEVNNDHFMLERSGDGVKFVKIGNLRGAGNSIEEQYYSFIDGELPAGNYYYRLTQVDFDGTATHFDIIAVKVHSGGHKAGLQIAPNPASGSTTLRIQGSGQQNARLQLFNSLGREVQSFPLQLEGGIQSMELSTAGLPPGHYTLLIISEKKGEVLAKERLAILR